MANSVKLADVVPSRFVHLTPPSEENIERIRADLEGGSKMLLNVPHVFKNEAGKYEILAGHDRTEAVRRTGKDAIPVRDFTGTVNSDDAILAHFCRENLLRKDISKAAIAGEWLRKHPEWSDGVIAEHSGCSREHVSTTRAELGVANPQVLASSRTGRDGKTREYKPRTVRSAVPSRRGIPHPSRVDAMRAQREARYEEQESGAKKAPEPDRGSTERSEPALSSGKGSPPEVGAPTGAARPEPKPTPAPPVEVAAPSVVLAVLEALPAWLPANPSRTELLALTDADEARLLEVSRWAQQMVAARRRVRTENVKVMP